MTEQWRRPAKKKYIPRNPLTTSAMMSKVKSRDSKAELLLRRALWSTGFRYRLHKKNLIGKPDIVFTKKKVAVFVDGDFWHGRAIIDEGVEGLRRGLRTERADWWVSKIQKTITRDKLVTQTLLDDGWRVLRFWESDILENHEKIVHQIHNYLES